MYAQLCKRLSEEAPDFEPRGSPCTFKLLLLNKCRTEFENRAQAFAAYEERALLPDEEEKRHLAKCKMLGNIKFIGELGKLEILAESILHRCIQNLLARRAAADHHEDLECLAQLVRTCGRVLDSERGRGLMDQYFARIETLSSSRDLAPRIRFMLRDVVELRRGGWVPRAASSSEGPVPMHQLRDDDSPPRRERDRDRHQDRDRDSLFRGGLRSSRPLDDVFAGLGLQPGSALVPPPDKLFGNGFSGRDGYRQRSAPGSGYFPRSANNNHSHYSKHQQGGAAGKDSPGSGGGAARGKTRLPPAGALHDLQMRPAPNSLMYTSRTKPPAAAPLAPVQPNVLAPAFSSAAPLLKEPAITIKPALDKKDKPKKDKGPNKEEACRLALEAVAGVARTWSGAGAEGEEEDDEEARVPALRRLVELQPPDKVVRRCIAGVLEGALAVAGEGAEAELWAACRVVRCMKRAPLHEAARQLLQAAAGSPPQSKDTLPTLLAHLVRARLLALAEVAAWCEGGAHHPLLLEVLQRLRDAIGMDALHRLYDESKIDLCAYVAESEGDAPVEEGGVGRDEARSARVLAALEARGLGALVPQLRVRAALARQLAAEPAPHALFLWIKGNVDATVRGSPAFVSALVTMLAAHVTRAAGGAPLADLHVHLPDKATLEREKQLLEAYAPLLSALLADRPDLQLAAVYAAQLHAHDHRYPKGMLLRWFMHLYNLEVCEEEAFLRWREDVTDAYPGKGEALFQVNTWLTWLQQQESEEEEGED